MDRILLKLNEVDKTVFDGNIVLTGLVVNTSFVDVAVDSA